MRKRHADWVGSDSDVQAQGGGGADINSSGRNGWGSSESHERRHVARTSKQRQKITIGGKIEEIYCLMVYQPSSSSGTILAGAASWLL
jgi:hypothetical protein